MASYFKRYYLDDVKLAQRALLEFDRALRSGRMIAFTGAMTTEARGYGTWDELLDAYAIYGCRIIDWIGQPTSQEKWEAIFEPLPGLNPEGKSPITHDAISKAFDYRRATSGRFDPRVVLGVVEESVLAATAARPEPIVMMPLMGGDGELDQIRAPIDLLSVMAARYFRSPHRDISFAESSQAIAKGHPQAVHDVLGALKGALGIRRYATLNYDLELEAQLMLHEAKAANPFTQLREMSTKGIGLSWDPQSGRIRRVLISGHAVESDILNRERIDRMLEFAIGADDTERHILHMHGRACTPDSMILSYRDYDKLYRNNGLSKLPFEFAQRIMIGGNPTVFVGLGMSENEVNDALQDFVSASPYQRMAPTFLLWNLHQPRNDLLKQDGGGKDYWREIEMRRLDWFHRLGVLAIFDTDLSTMADDGSRLISFGNPKTSELAGDPKRSKAAAGVNNLCWLISNLRANADKVAKRENLVTSGHWRQMTEKIDKANPSESGIVLWRVQKGLSDSGDEAESARIEKIAERIDALEASNDGRIVGVVGSAGTGHGAQSRKLMELALARGITPNNILLVNACFSFDTDSLLDGIVRFLDKRRIQAGIERYIGPDGMTPQMSRGEYFRRLATEQKAGTGDRLLIIVNGLERLYNLSGELLSAEFDELLAYAATGMPQVTWVLFGTRRVATDFVKRNIAVFNRDENDSSSIPSHNGCTGLPIRRYEAISAAFAETLGKPAKPADRPGDQLSRGLQKIAKIDFARQRALDQEVDAYVANSVGRIRGDGSDLRRVFYQRFLGPLFEKAIRDVPQLGRHTAPMAREMLRALAFIGLPTEVSVLVHVPRINRMFAVAESAMGCAPYPRLQRVNILADIAEQLIELKLILQIQGFPLPANDSALHNRLALPRTLLTELRYRFSVPLSEAKLSTAFNMSLYAAQPVDGYIPEPDIHDELGDTIDRLLGAYRDWPEEPGQGLRKKEKDELHAWLNDAVAEVAPHEHEPGRRRRTASGEPSVLINELHALCRVEHGQCLRAALALVRGYYTTTDLLTLDVGDRLIREDRDGILLEHAERLDCLIDAYGKTMIMRDLMRNALDKCLISKPSDFTEIDPFYPDELVWLHNERGVVRLAMGDLPEAAASFNRALEINRRHVERNDRSHNWRRIQLNQLTIDVERGNLGVALRKAEEILAVSEKPNRLREDKLAAAIAHGYSARVHHLQGNRKAAAKAYKKAISSAENLKEVRCQAYFLRMRAEFGGPQGEEDLAAAFELANACRQMDIVYRLRVMHAALALEGESPDDRPRQQRTLDDSVRYALQTDMHRVRVEAGAVQAEARLRFGDFEGALRHVSDAMMVATRFDMELRKIWLRSLMARIMAARGHPVTAQKLALSAIRIASRRRYEHAIKHAEDTLLTLPRNSAIDQVIDATMRRQL